MRSGSAKEEITYAMDAIQSPVSLYEPVYTDGGDPLCVMDQISDKKNREENWVEQLSLSEAMKHLPTRERHIIDMRFFEGKDPDRSSLREVGISQAQVSRLGEECAEVYEKLSVLKFSWYHLFAYPG